MRRLIPIVLMTLLASCGDWPDFPNPPEEPPTPPQLLPIDAFTPRIDDPEATQKELQARGAALEARAAALRTAQP